MIGDRVVGAGVGSASFGIGAMDGGGGFDVGKEMNGAGVFTPLLGLGAGVCGSDVGD